MDACRTRLGRGGPGGQGALPVQLLLRPRTLGIVRPEPNYAVSYCGQLWGHWWKAEDSVTCPLPSTSGLVLNKTVWVLNNFFEILSES